MTRDVTFSGIRAIRSLSKSRVVDLTINLFIVCVLAFFVEKQK